MVVWNVSVGGTAQGLGVVIATNQMCPEYHKDVWYSGNNGCLVLIIRTGEGIYPARFVLGKWRYGEEEPMMIASFPTIQMAMLTWEEHVKNM